MARRRGRRTGQADSKADIMPAQSRPWYGVCAQISPRSVGSRTAFAARVAGTSIRLGGGAKAQFAVEARGVFVRTGVTDP